MNITEAISLGIVLAVFATVSAALAFMKRRYYLVNIALSLYIVTAIMTTFPREWFSGAMTQLVVVLGLIGSVVFFGPMLFWANDKWSDHRIPWRFIFFGVAVLGMATTIVMPYADAAGIGVSFLDKARIFFYDEKWRFGWMIAPVLFAIILRKI